MDQKFFVLILHWLVISILVGLVAALVLKSVSAARTNGKNSDLITALKDENEMLKASLKEAYDYQRLKAWKAELAKRESELDSAVQENREYLEKVIDSVSRSLDGSPVWGFSDSSPFPGATAINVNYQEREDDGPAKIVLRGKTAYEPAKAEQILNEVNPARRLSIAVRSLQIQGIGDRLAKFLLNSPAVSYTFTREVDPETGGAILYILYQVEAYLRDDTYVFDLDKK